MSNKEQNSIAVPGFTAKASLNDTIEEYRSEIQTYVTKDLEYAIQLSMAPEECARVCERCFRSDLPCCVRFDPKAGSCHAGCCFYA